jgi:4-amino-4-deoxy-L-arabinose transferase-like glycosyltransferase
MVRAHEDGRTGWIVLACALVGTGFITKMLQAFVVMPVFALVYLAFGPLDVWRRVRQLAIGAGALVVASGWWVAIVALWPASSRPYIGGSQDNSILNLIFGYNGFGRITGNETGSVAAGAAGSANRWGPTGWNRLWQSDWGGQVAWLIPTALVLLAAGLVITARRGRTDRTRVAFLLWGGWLVLTAAVFSFASGIIHPYYSVALAPAIGALVGMGAVTLWRTRESWFSRGALAVALATTSIVSYQLLGRSPNWHPSLRGVVLCVGLIVAAGILFAPVVAKELGIVLAIAALAVGLAGPSAYAWNTAATVHSGALPSAGPAVTGNRFGFGPAGGGGFGLRGFGGAPNGSAGGNLPGLGGTGGALPGNGNGFGRRFGNGNPFGGGAGGGFLNATTASSALVKALRDDASSYTWAAATVNSNSAAGYQLASGEPVMAIGGFNGTDPSPTLAQFEQYVREGKIHYYIAGGIGGRFGGTASQITQWVEQNYTQTTIGGTQVYDLSASNAT